jgi:hypothetical protein
MIRSVLAILALVATNSAAFAQSSKGPVVLKPSSAWHVDYAEDRCRLARQFGEGDELVYAFFDRYGPTEYFRLTLAGKPLKGVLKKGEVEIQFGPNEGQQQLAFFAGNLGKLPALLVVTQARVAPPTPADLTSMATAGPGEWINLEPVGGAREGAIRTLVISKAVRRNIILETGSMRKPLEALGTCMDNLMTTWGIDVERHKSLTQTANPLNTPQNWVVSRDYPLDMLDAGQPAIVEFRLSIGSDGVPTACHIQSTTRPKAFDDAVCNSVMKRARFKPALDAQGKPLASYYRSSVRFQIP